MDKMDKKQMAVILAGIAMSAILVVSLVAVFGSNTDGNTTWTVRCVDVDAPQTRVYEVSYDWTYRGGGYWYTCDYLSGGSYETWLIRGETEGKEGVWVMIFYDRPSGPTVFEGGRITSVTEL